MLLRDYRHIITGRDLVSFQVKIKETDLLIRATRNLSVKALKLTSKYRGHLERYIERYPEFTKSLVPLPLHGDEPAIVRTMLEAGRKAGVGPMAAVAGAIAEFVGRDLLRFTPELIIENGGDIFLKVMQKRTVGIYAGESPFSGRIGLEIESGETPLGVCTSSGTVGHSLSKGKADAVVVVSSSVSLADAMATSICNTIQKDSDIEPALELVKNIPEVTGIIIIKGDKMGSRGNIRICGIEAEWRNA